MRVYGKPSRPLWNLQPGIRFLNHGSYGATPLEVVAEQDRWRARMEAQPVRFMQSEYPSVVRAAAQKAAVFVGTSSERFVFVENATAGINAVLRSLSFASGDEILTTTHVYGAVRQLLRYVAATSGVRIVEADVPMPACGPTAVTRANESRMSERTALVVVDHIASASGLIFPAAEIVALCRSRNVPVLVDGAHAPGQIDLAIDGIGADWYVGNFHKWLCAPKGAGFLVAGDRDLPQIHPAVISHFYGQGLVAEFDWIGTRDPTAWLSVPCALDFHERLGGGALRVRNRDLVLDAARAAASAISGPLGGPVEMFGSMATFALPEGLPPTFEMAMRLHDLLLERHQIEVPIIPFADRLWVRLSAHAYNDAEDYEGLGTILKALTGALRSTLT